MEWASQNEFELAEDWERAVYDEPLKRIAPLE